MGSILEHVINYKKNRQNFTVEERKAVKRLLRVNIRVDMKSFQEAVDQLNNL